MARPSDLIPNRYEVVKLITGAEICGMTRDMDDGIEILLPMTCNLQPVELQVIVNLGSPGWGTDAPSSPDANTNS